jgi:ComF family protein
MSAPYLQKLLAVLFPQRTVCHICGASLTSGEGMLCEDCAKALTKNAYSPKLAPVRLNERIAFAASAYPYGGAAATLAKALKFGSDITAALPLAERMAAVYAALPPLREAEVCVAVPMHKRRLRQRGYNQAEVLAEAFARMVGLPVETDVLLRVHHKRSQIGQGRVARRRNIAGAFAVNESNVNRIAGRRGLLIDDVLTTGATAEECAAALLSAGAQAVLLLTACRA